MKKYFEAFEFASHAHRSHFRKINGTPYISHPMAVAFALEKLSSNSDLVIAGVLHDILEDTDTPEESLKERFGDNVTRLVKAVTENKLIQNWKERKQAYITRISESGSDVKMLSFADKLHNLYSIESDVNAFGDVIWSKFSAPKCDQKWYYVTLLQVYQVDNEDAMSGLIDEMQELIGKVFDR